MKDYNPIYRDVKDWVILDTITIHDFSIDEQPIEAVELLIGTLHYQAIDFNQKYYENRTPIIRWLTRKEYERLVENAGTIIW